MMTKRTSARKTAHATAGKAMGKMDNPAIGGIFSFSFLPHYHGNGRCSGNC